MNNKYIPSLGHFIIVPHGQFLMGNNSSYKSLYGKKLIERPQARNVHNVEITKDIAVLESPVTNAMFQVYAKDNLKSLGKIEFNFIANKIDFSEFHFKNKSEKLIKKNINWQSTNLINLINKNENNNLPVIGVGYFECLNYCNWLTDRLKCKVRLLTEAEWEYCARAGKKTIYHWGDKIASADQYAWFFDNSELKIQPVKRLAPNDWRLYDMTGNVWEWCADKYSQNFYNYSNKTDPISTHGNCKRYVIRGGSALNKEGVILTV
ncbi:MAG: SUMF1/EgtB/PvdO family nonheme iron enzyme [Pseudomonadota bacterium]